MSCGLLGSAVCHGYDDFSFVVTCVLKRKQGARMAKGEVKQETKVGKVIYVFEYVAGYHVAPHAPSKGNSSYP